jgi:hypothetical protein
MANGTISMQIRKSWIATEICSGPSTDQDQIKGEYLVVCPTDYFLRCLPSRMAPEETKRAMMTLCQKEKKMMAFTHKNLGKGLNEESSV